MKFRHTLFLALIPLCLFGEQPTSEQVLVSVKKWESTVDLSSALAKKEIYVKGEVRNPGTFKVDRDFSVFDALNASGGPHQVGSKTEFTIFSPSQGLSISWKGAQFHSTEGIALTSRIFLRYGDVLYIPELCRL